MKLKTLCMKIIFKKDYIYMYKIDDCKNTLIGAIRRKKGRV